ncbi:MAG: hypothetical protein NXI24_04040 [bacterium]|nr:hypothetical protein [bacterium]
MQSSGSHSSASPAGAGAIFVRYAPTFVAWTAALCALYFAALYVAGFEPHVIENPALNSDALYPFLFWRDVFDGAFLGGWNPPLAPYVFPDLLIVFPAVFGVRLFDGSPLSAVLLASGAMGFAWLIAYDWLFRVLGRRCRWDLDPTMRRLQPLAAPLAGALVFGWIAAGLGGGAVEYLLVPTFHAGAAILLPLVLGLSLIALEPQGHTDAVAVDDDAVPVRKAWRSGAFARLAPRRICALVALAFLIALGVASDRLFYPAALLPVLVTLPLLFFVPGRRALSGPGWYAIAVMAGLLLARGFRGWLADRIYLSELKPEWGALFSGEGLAAIWSDVGSAGAVLFAAPAIPLIVSALILIGTGVLLWPTRERRSDARTRIALSSWLLWMIAAHLAMVAMLLAGMLTIGYLITGSSAVWRYAAPALSLPVAPAVLCVFVLVSERRRCAAARRDARESRTPSRPVRFAQAIGGACAIVALSSVLYAVRPEFRSAAAIRADSQSHRLADCLSRNAAEIGRFGFSDYWTAKAVSYLSGGRVLLNQLDWIGRPKLWINNYEWFYQPHRAGDGYGFVVLDRLDRSAIVKRFGAPTRSLFCDESEIFVYDPRRTDRLRFAYPPELMDLTLDAIGRRRH